MTIRGLLALACSTLLVGCAADSSTTTGTTTATSAGAGSSHRLAGNPDTPQPWAAPPLERSVAVFDGRTGERVAFGDMLDRLADADAVFLGETHNDETTHRVELAVYESLLDARDGAVVLAMEMFERDVQPVLDRYVRGEIDEPAFLKESRPWGQYRSAYRPLIERARAGGHPVVASNIPRPLTRRIAMNGLGVLDELPEDERGHAPSEIIANTPAYWSRVDNAIRGHVGMMSMSGGDEGRLTSTQTLWDNTMGESCALALAAHPGLSVLHINGGFHSKFSDGTVRQLALRAPDARTMTVDITPVGNLTAFGDSVEVGERPVADFLVMAESRASDGNGGVWSVADQRSMDYRFRLPPGATDASPVPLLIWIGDDGLRASDAMDLWMDRLGGEAAIAAIEPPYRALNADGSEGGRWFWADSFAGDVGSLVGATERAWAYLLRSFPIDPDRVVLAGEGAGGTVVAAAGLFANRMEPNAVAFDPRQYAALKDFPLPLSAAGGARERDASVTVLLSDDEGQEWWGGELAEYERAGLATGLAVHGDAEQGDSAGNIAKGLDAAQEETLRRALGLHASETAEGIPATVRVPADAPRARHWARLAALRFARETGRPTRLIDHNDPGEATVELGGIVSPETVADALPRCPGPFGGTTVLVLPSDLNQADLDAWMALEENDPLNKRSRFHRVRIARTDADAGERALPELLATLEGQGRKNILIVPAAFYADARRMDELRSATRDAADRMTLRWLPGLGGENLPITAGLATSLSSAPIGTVRHDLRVTLEPEAHRIEVIDTIMLPKGARAPGSSFVLNSELEILESDPPVEAVGDASGDNPPRKTRYALTAGAQKGTLTLRYRGTIDHGIADEKEQYSRGIRESFGVVGPEGVYLNGATAWVPAFADELVRFELEVEAPADWHIISQGNGNSDADHPDADQSGQSTRTARWESGADLEQVYLVGGPLTVFRDAAGAVETLVYLHDADEPLARKYLDATARYIEMYRQLIGPYPYGKFALVENFWETGYGMPSFTLLGEQVIRLPFILHSSYPHEILHNWWGNSVFVDYETGNWCEGLTAYMADHLIQEQRGTGINYRRDTLQKFRSFVTDGRDFPLREFRSRHSGATEAVGYGKSLMVFHMLRTRFGDDAFRAAMADFYRKNRGDRAGFDDLRASFESVTGEDLGSFFEQWVDQPGAPALALRNAQRTDEGGAGEGRLGGNGMGRFAVRGIIEQTQEGDPFALRVPVLVATASGQRTEWVEINKRSTPFEIPTDARPLALAVDPAFDVFRLLDPHETPASIGQIFGEPRVLAVVAQGEDGALYRELMEGWNSPNHAIEIVRDDEIDRLPDDRGVWLLGASNRFAANLHLIDRTAGVVMLGIDSVPFAGNALVAVRRNPRNPEKAVGWIAIDRAEAFPGMGRKLPHYGKYSYLAFEGDEPTNFHKGQNATTDSPLVAEFAASGGATVTPEPRPALAELPPAFSQRDLLGHVEWLASPEREGRGLGSEGLRASAEYIASRFESAGLHPAGDEGPDGPTWFQEFKVREGPEGSPVTAVNVVGVLPGAKQEWADQSIVVGAHYDHLGLGWPDVHAGDEGAIHHGADDNASGVAVLLELATNIASEGSPSRNLVFVAFSAEEAGRLGSKHYTTDPVFPIEGIRGMINMDTVGRLGEGEIAVHATGTADEWQHIFRGVGFVTGIRSRNIPARVGGSDEESFIEAGVPAVHLFTGAHADYHRPTDTVEKVDGPGLVKVAAFVKEALAYLVEREPPMAVRIEGKPQAGAGHDHGQEPGQNPSGSTRRVSFGTVPSFGFQGPGVLVESVVPDSPAAKGGVQAGDVLLRLDGAEIADLRGFSDLLKTMTPGQEVAAVVRRDGEELELRVRVEAR